MPGQPSCDAGQKIIRLLLTITRQFVRGGLAKSPSPQFSQISVRRLIIPQRVFFRSNSTLRLLQGTLILSQSDPLASILIFLTLLIPSLALISPSWESITLLHVRLEFSYLRSVSPIYVKYGMALKLNPGLEMQQNEMVMSHQHAEVVEQTVPLQISASFVQSSFTQIIISKWKIRL